MKSCNEMAAIVMKRINEEKTICRPRRIKKAIVLAVILSILTALCAVTGVAVIRRYPSFLDHFMMRQDGFEDDTALPNRTFTDGTGKSIELYYVYSSKTAAGQTLHHYVDTSRNEYIVDGETMISKMPSNSGYESLYDQNLPASCKKLTDEEIQKKAVPYAVALLGETEFEKYEKVEIERGEDMLSAQVNFIELYNGMFEIRRCQVTFNYDADEVILSQSMTEYENFDFALLEAVTQDKIDAYVLKRMKRCFGKNPLPDYRIHSYSLMLNNNDRYYLEINVVYDSETPHLNPAALQTQEQWYTFLYLVGDPMKMNEEEAILLAKQYFTETYGEKALAGFNDFEVRYNHGYDVRMQRTYRDIFILDTCSVDMEKTGALSHIFYGNQGENDGLDLTQLDDTARMDIVALAHKVAERKFGDRLRNVECDGTAYIVKKDGKYYMSIAVTCKFGGDQDMPEDFGYYHGLQLLYEVGGPKLSDPAALERVIIQEISMD